MGSDGFEPPKATPAELQSAPFGHSGNCPCFKELSFVLRVQMYAFFLLTAKFLTLKMRIINEIFFLKDTIILSVRLQIVLFLFCGRIV